MSEIGPTYEATKETLGIVPNNELASLSISTLFFLGGGLAAVPPTAQRGYTALLDDGTLLPITSAYVTQHLGSLMSADFYVVGGLTSSGWVENAIGRIIDFSEIAKDLKGNIITNNLLGSFTVTSINYDGTRIILSSISTIPAMAKKTIEINNLLFLSTNNTGRRTLRCSVPWGVQVGDLLTHKDIADFIVGRMTITLAREYSVLDATEVV